MAALTENFRLMAEVLREKLSALKQHKDAARLAGDIAQFEGLEARVAAIGGS